MNTENLWILVLAIATPISGVIGFAIQIRRVKKIRLENEKLQLEISALQRHSIEVERRLVIPSNQEVQKIACGEVMFSRTSSREPEAFITHKKQREKIKNYLLYTIYFLIFSLILMVLWHLFA